MASDMLGETFTLFPKLPTEIRLKIWKDAAFLPRNLDVFTVPMGVITMGVTEEDEPEDHFTPFRFVSAQAVPAMLHACNESRAVGLKHYKPRFTAEYEFRSFTFNTPPHIYYNNISDRVGFHGTFIEGSDPEICACIRGYETKYLSINVSDIDDGYNYSDGARGVDLVCDLYGWFHEAMEELQIYVSPVPINKGERFHFVEFDMANIGTEEGEMLVRAKKDIEGHIQRCVIGYMSSFEARRANLIEKCKQEGKPVPEPDEPIVWQHPAIKFVSLVRDSGPGDD